jgi:predicted anti-sigma-YlaC factor YlaD
MDHVNDSQMLELLGEHLPETEHRQLMAHIDQCDRCREYWQQLSDSWNLLGDWDIDTTDVDLRARIMARVQQNTDIQWHQAGSLLKVAASILIAVSVGHVAGRLYRANAPHTTDQQIVQAMHLGILSPNSATGWSDPLLQTDETGGASK